MTKTLVLIRHAHRDTSNRELDNGLSDKGKDQAKDLRRFFSDRFDQAELKDGLWLVSSPKKRCLETLNPIAKLLDRTVDIHPGLDEASMRESTASFTSRIEQFLREWQQSKAALTLLCSHGDWLPMAVNHLLGIHQEFKKGGWLEVEWQGGSGRLSWYAPTLKYFYR